MVSVGLLRRRLLSASALVSAFSFLSATAQAGALPHGGHFAEGHGTLNKAGQSLTVRQSSTTGIVDWNSFSIGHKNAVTFHNGSGATLNRVTGGNLSTIAGSLHATGSLYLMNSSGVIVSGTGRVVTGGSFVASSSNNGAFQRDQLKLTRGKVVNRGTIVAGSGVTLAGRDVGDSGNIRATNVTLKAANSLKIDGTITARNADGSGGAIVVTARHIAVGGMANISASGTRGGTVLIGGDVHGGAIASDNFVRQSIGDAKTTKIAQGAQISADASKTAGGNIVIWSDGHTSFDGTISAKGQTVGGFAEVSSHDLLGFTGRVDLTSTHGTTGTLLLDPENVTIEDETTAGGSLTSGTFTPNADDSILNVADLEAALATASVKVTTGSSGAQSGDITVLDRVTWSSGHTLTLDAYHSVIIDAPIAILGAGSLTLKTDDGGTGGTYSIGDGAFVDYGAINNGGKLTINGKSYKLLYTMAQVQAINASGSKLSANYALATPLNAASVSGWIPLGTDGAGNVNNNENGFAGTFEGLGNTISNLTVNIAAQDAGLFGYSSGTIRDIGLIGDHVSGSKYVGELVGFNSTGTIINAFATGSGSVTATNSFVGGLVGYNSSGTITRAFSTVAVNAADNDYVGGFVGDSHGSISDSYSSGKVSGGDEVGGFIGYNGGAISASYATGTVSGTYDVGGFVGYSESDGTVEESYASGAATGTTDVGGFVGSNFGGVGDAIDVYYNDTRNATGYGNNNGTISTVGLTTSEMMTSSQFIWADFGATPGGAAGQTWVIVDIDGSLNHADNASGGTFPMLLSEYSTNIVNAHQLQLMELDLSANYTLATSFSAAATNNKDVWSTTGFSPIGGNNAGADFTGTFDGDGHTISGLTIDNGTDANVGLFGDSDGAIDNVKLTSAAISSIENGTEGILVGVNGGAITDVSTSGSVKLDSSLADAGGLAGDNTGSIGGSSSSAAVSNSTTTGRLGGLAGYSSGTIDSSSASGKVSGVLDIYAGGLVGENYEGAVVNSHASGKVVVTSGSGAYVGGLIGYDYYAQVSGSHATGAVSADDSYIGGLIGEANYDDVANSYASGAVSGKDGDAGGLAGFDYYGGVSDSHASGKVTLTYGTGTTNYAGGLIGEYDDDTYNSIDDSYATGAVSADGQTAAAGGLVGYLYYYSEIINSHASGAVSVKSENGDSSYAGGLVGEAYEYNNVDDSYAKGKVTGDDLTYAGGLIGYSSTYNSVDNDYATGAVKGYAAGGLIGYSYYFNFTTNSHASGNVTGLLDGGTSYVGGLIGYSSMDQSLVSLYATGNVDGASGSSTDAGGLIGDASDTSPLVSSYATGSVKGAFDAGGLVGISLIPIIDSYATGDVTAILDGNAGGLAGYSDKTISDSYATGNVTAVLGSDSYVGGLVGANSGAIDHSFATGNVVAAGSTALAGGLVGSNDEPLSYVYATGSVTDDGTAGGTFGGLVGSNSSSITQAYAVGDVSGTGAGDTGGLVGVSSGGTVTAGYWDKQTSGQSTSAGGTGLTTAQLQSGLPSGFSSGDWAIVPGVSFPYLKWQVASGTPEVVSGTISGETSDADLAVHVRVNGTVVTPLVTMSSGANGYYYELLAPGTISNSGSDVLAYLVSGSAHANNVYQNATGSLTGFNLAADTLKIEGAATSETALLAAIEKALGTNFGDALYTSSGSFHAGTDVDLDLSAASFTIDHAINIGAGALSFDAAGNVTQSSSDAITAKTLTGSSAGDAAFTSATNKITDLGAFSTAGHTFELTDDHALTTTGTVNSGAGTLDITTESGDALAIDSKLKTTATMNLTGGAAISESTTVGAVDAKLLNVTAKTGIVLTSTHNNIKHLGTDHTNSGQNHVTL